jgi:hypothetical protein
MTMQTMRRIPPINWAGVPLRYHDKVAAVCRTMKECEDLVYWFGDAEFCPFLGILLLIPKHPVLLHGMGYASAAELKDDAVQLWGKYTQRLTKQEDLVDFDYLREKYGLPERSKVKELTAEAFHNRILAHKANPVTDPPRQPLYPRVNGKTVFAQTQSEDWKSND